MNKPTKNYLSGWANFQQDYGLGGGDVLSAGHGELNRRVYLSESSVIKVVLFSEVESPVRRQSLEGELRLLMKAHLIEQVPGRYSLCVH